MKTSEFKKATKLHDSMDCNSMIKRKHLKHIMELESRKERLETVINANKFILSKLNKIADRTNMSSFKVSFTNLNPDLIMFEFYTNEEYLNRIIKGLFKDLEDELKEIEKEINKYVIE